jgi:DedD protein
MALFKFRKGGDASPSSPAQPETVEALRRRARHRLIGAAVLVLLGIIGFPLLFDTQPRPVAVDIPIEIPDRNKTKPLPPPAAAVAQPKPAEAPAAAKADAAKAEPAKAEAAKAEAAKIEAAKSEAAKLEAAKSEAAKTAAAKAESKPRPDAAAQAKAEQPAKPAPSAPVPPADAARAQALLEGKPVQAGSADAAEGRFVVQVGAFADVVKARETRLKVEKAGLKTYTHVAETKEGKRIRVRVGPFATRSEADKAAGKIKELELPASVLTL